MHILHYLLVLVIAVIFVFSMQQLLSYYVGMYLSVLVLSYFSVNNFNPVISVFTGFFDNSICQST